MDPPNFLDLPGEIRNQIYTHLLVVPPLSQPRLLGDPPIYPQILGVCRKINSEALAILYSNNTFLAHPSLLASLPRLRLYYSPVWSSSIIALIQRFHIRIRLDCDPNFNREKAAEAFSGKEELTIEVFQAQFGSCGYGTLKLFEGIRGVKRCRVYGSVTSFPEYVNWLQDCMVAPRGQIIDKFDAEKVGDTKHGGR